MELKELEKLLKLLRKHGVSEAVLPEGTFKIDLSHDGSSKPPIVELPPANPQTEEVLTDEDIAFWSAGE